VRGRVSAEWFEACLAKAKVTGFTWHCLRHTFASRLVMAGVDIYTVKELLGHKTITVTMRYAHLASQHQLAAVQRLCDTEHGQKQATDTKTSTSDFERAEPITASPQ
jgi:site-specific recombinase XerD